MDSVRVDVLVGCTKSSRVRGMPICHVEAILRHPQKSHFEANERDGEDEQPFDILCEFAADRQRPRSLGPFIWPRHGLQMALRGRHWGLRVGRGRACRATSPQSHRAFIQRDHRHILPAINGVFIPRPHPAYL